MRMGVRWAIEKCYKYIMERLSVFSPPRQGDKDRITSEASRKPYPRYTAVEPSRKKQGHPKSQRLR